MLGLLDWLGEHEHDFLLVLVAIRDLAPAGPPALLEAARDVTALGGLLVLGLLTLRTAAYK